MEHILQWTIPIIVGILTFFAGRSFERYKLAQVNRLKLLEPIETWVERASQLVGIVGDDISSVASGLAYPSIYSVKDRLETAKSLGEYKEKIFGILKSKALNTRGTRGLSTRLSDLVIKLSMLIEQEYLQADLHLLEKMNLKQDLTAEIMTILAATSTINILIQEIHTCLSELKIRFT